jgi:hypothetical protein
MCRVHDAVEGRDEHDQGDDRGDGEGSPRA